jgi:hypothetical protein
MATEPAVSSNFIENPTKWTFWHNATESRTWLLVDYFINSQNLIESHVVLKELIDGEFKTEATVVKMEVFKGLEQKNVLQVVKLKVSI